MRIKKQDRQDAVNAIIKEKIQTKVEAIRKEFVLILEDTVNNRYPISINQWMANSPEGGLHSKSSYTLRFNDKNIHHLLLNNLNSNRYTTKFKLNKPTPVLTVDYYTDTLDINKKHSRKVNYLLNQLDTLEDEKYTLISVVSSALQACNTRKQLQDNYPDLVKYLPKITPQSKGLTITNKDVIKVLGSL